MKKEDASSISYNHALRLYQVSREPLPRLLFTTRMLLFTTPCFFPCFFCLPFPSASLPPRALRLHQHTDSSCPPHGVPGLVLSMHYVEGYGANTLTDGFAVARALREVG